MRAVRFLKEFLRHPQLTGTFFASTSTMADVITDWAEVGNASSIVELGSGDGVFTKKIVEKMPREADFFALEINPHFAKQTRRACPRVAVYEDSAVHIKKYLRQHGRQQCDVIVSALPWAAFTRKQQIELLDAAVDSLSPGGRFVTIAYVTGRPTPAGRNFQRLLQDRFATVEVSPIVWKNRPPAVVYRADKAV